jgi:CHASE2 domain-containing sensor protein
MLAPTGPFHTLDYADLDKWPPMKDKVAFVGAPPSDRGVLQTPYGRMTPLEFTAAVYEALAQKRGLRVADTRWDVLATALAELAALGLVRLLARPFVVAMVLGAVCLVGVTAIGAGGGPWLAPLPPLLACSLAVGALAWKTR